MTVRGCFAETTTPTLLLRWKRRQPVTACVAAAACDTVAAARLRVTVLRTTERGAVAVAAARGAAAVLVFFAAAVFFTAVVFAAVAALADVDFFAVFSAFFSAIRRSLSLLQHGQRTRDAAARGGQPAIVLQLAGRQLEAEVEELFLRALELVGELGVRQPPHFLQLHCRPLPGPLGIRTSS